MPLQLLKSLHIVLCRTAVFDFNNPNVTCPTITVSKEMCPLVSAESGGFFIICNDKLSNLFCQYHCKMFGSSNL